MVRTIALLTLAVLVSSVPAQKKPPAAKPKAVPAEQIVEAQGEGTTVEEARKDALREAVRKAAGVMVNAETTTDGDKVIRDQVLTYSDGVVAPEGYKELAREKDGDVHRVKISVRIISRKLAERMKEAGLKVRDIDGASIEAAVLTRVEARKRATELLAGALGDLPNCLVAQAAPVGAKDYDEDAGELRVAVSVAVDPKAYRATGNQLKVTLDKVCVESGTFAYVAKAQKARDLTVFGPARKGGGEGKAAERQVPTPLLLSKPAPPRVIGKKGMAAPAGPPDFMALNVAKDAKGWWLWLLVNHSPDFSSVAWRAYQLDSDLAASLKPLDGTPTLVVSLMSKDGDVLAKRSIELALQARLPGRRGDAPVPTGWLAAHHQTRAFGRDAAARPTDNVAVGPVLMLGGAGMAPAEAIKTRIKLKSEELGKLGEVRCKVEFRR